MLATVGRGPFRRLQCSLRMISIAGATPPRRCPAFILRRAASNGPSVAGRMWNVGEGQPRMELHQIRYFLALSEALNFTKAAEVCHVPSRHSPVQFEIWRKSSAACCSLASATTHI